MSLLTDRIRQLGGAAATHELYAIGATRESLRIAVRAHDIRRIRQGWYIDPDTPSSAANAMRVGGRATCASAAEYHGLWMLERPTTVHVAVAPNACQLRDPLDYRRRLDRPDAVVHWSETGHGRSRLSVPLPHALVELAGCQGAEAAFVAAESALARRLLRPEEWKAGLEGAPMHTRLVLEHSSGSSGSITESVFRFRIRATGLRLRAQVQIGHDRVDFVVGDRLVVEVDGREFHERERDYARDARLSARGYRVLRFSYRQVVHEWQTVELSVLSAVARGDAA